MNIYHIWLPTKDDIFVTQDVTFEPGRFYTGDDKYSPESMIEEVIEVLEYPVLSRDEDIEIDELLTLRQHYSHEETPEDQNTGSQVGGEHESEYETAELDDQNASGLSILKQLDKGKAKALHSPTEQRSKEEPTPEGYSAYGDLAPQDINLELDDSNIVVGKRMHKACDLNVFAVHVQATDKGTPFIADYLYTFTTETTKSQDTPGLPRVHHTQLPPLPKYVKDLDMHHFGLEFQEAIQWEWQSLRGKGCFRGTKVTMANANAEVLPLMWVFNYKIT